TTAVNALTAPPLRIECRNLSETSAVDANVYATFYDLSNATDCNDIIRIFVFRNRRFRRLLIGCKDRSPQFGRAPYTEVSEQIADERSVHHRTVFVCYRSPCRQTGPVDTLRTEQCQVRGEQKERNSPSLVKTRDARNDRKGRIVHHHAIRGIIETFVIAAGPKGANDRTAADGRIPAQPFRHGFIYRRDRKSTR